MKQGLPLVFFDGNCQGQHLAAILSASNIAECYAVGQDLGFLPSHLGVACRYVDEHAVPDLIAAGKRSGRVIIQASQSTPMSSEQEMSYTSLVDGIARFPHVQFYSVSPDEALQRLGPKATPKRAFGIDLSIVEMCQKRSGTSIDVAGFIRENSSSRPLFHTALHPGGEVTGKLARIVAEQLPNADGHVLDRLEHHFKRSEGIGSLTFHPVAIEILEELGFDWGPDYELYRQMMLARASADWPRLIEHSAHYQEKFQNDTWYWLSMTQAYIASGSFVEAKLSHSKLVELCPGNLQTWMLGLSLYQKFGDRVDIDGLIHRASSFFQGQRIFSQMMAFFHLKLGDAFAAEPYARDYHARTPDRADALVPLLMTLRFLDRLPEVRDIIEYERSIATPARLSEIEANLAGTEFEQYIASGAADQQRLSLAVRA